MGRRGGATAEEELAQAKIPFPQVKNAHDDAFKQLKKGSSSTKVASTSQEAPATVKRSSSKRSVSDKGAEGTTRTTRSSRAKEVREVSVTLKPKSKTTASPIKAARRSAATSSKKSSSAVQYFQSWEINGDEYTVGDDVYIVRTEDMGELPDGEEEDMCVACSRTNKPHTIIECDRCLGGFHMGCLKPALKKVPEGVWLCPSCERGEPPAANRQLRTAYEKFLFAPVDKQILCLGRIMGFVKNRKGDGEVEWVCRYYCLPQETYLGRQPHHASREVFVSGTQEHFEPVECIFGPAQVVGPKEFDDAQGTDVYLCEYEYDEKWKRFRRCPGGPAAPTSQPGAKGAAAAAGKAGRGGGGKGRVLGDDSDLDSDDEDFNAAAEVLSSDEDDEDRDRSFKPIYAFWAEKGMLPAGFKGRRVPQRGGAGAAAGAGAGASIKPKAGGALNRQASAAVAAEMDLGASSDEEGGLQLAGAAGGVAAVPSRAPVGPLQGARKALSLSAVPDTLPCREEEKKGLRRFMEDAINEEGGSGPGVLYVCGVPGTGKTACIGEVLHGLRPQAQEKGVQLITLNALSLPTPAHVYTKLWEKLTGQRWGPARALAALEAMFSCGSSAAGAGPSSSGRAGARQCMTLVVVDEIDVLITKDQSVLYNLFEWPVRPGARLAVMGISNTHDLDARVLPRIASRLASSKLAFNPYTKEHLMTIAKQRLDDAGLTGLFPDIAMDWAARKVASNSGDVRRMLELMRRAVEVLETSRRRKGMPAVPAGSPHGGLISVEHVKVAIQEMYSSPHMQFLRACSKLEKVALAALLMEMKATSKADASIQAVHQRLVSHAALLVPDMPRIDSGGTARLLFGLAAKRLLHAGPSWQALKARVALAVHKDDVCTAIKEDQELQNLINQA